MHFPLVVSPLQGNYCILLPVPPLLHVIAASASNLKAVLASSAEYTELANEHAANDLFLVTLLL